jgi:hypothetical protein
MSDRATTKAIITKSIINPMAMDDDDTPSFRAAETPTKLRQEVVYLKQRIEYQQSLLEDERRVTDELLANKNRTIDGLQQQLKAAEEQHQAEMGTFQQKIDEVR